MGKDTGLERGSGTRGRRPAQQDRDGACATRQAFLELAEEATRGAARDDHEGREAYQAYIGSRDWLQSAARLAELQASGGRCRLCNRAPPAVRLEAHHRTYRNFGRELVGDLTTLCSSCHDATTEMLRARRRATSALERR